MSDIGPGATATPAPPANGAEARAVLDSRIADPAWGAKLLHGDVDARREYSELRAKADAADPADKVAAAMAGVMPDTPFQDSGHVLMVNTTNMLRELGIRDPVIKQTLEGYEISQEEHDVVARWKADRMKDSEWVKKWLSGEGEQAREMMLANIVLSSNVKDARGRF
jgi:hypothetical protein